MNKIHASLILLSALFLSSELQAEVKPNGVFSDHAVFQCGVELPVWGTARDGEKVTVEFAGQKISTIARHGKWMVKLAPLKASAKPATLTITGENKVVLRDILVGEVWIASGQSNMDWQLKGGIENWQAEAAAANYPQFRLFTVGKRISDRPLNEVEGHWSACSPQTAPDFSAVAFFFGRDLQKALNVPVGVVVAAWGGTVAEAWTSGQSLKTMSDFTGAVARVEQEASKSPLDYDRALAELYAQHDPGSASGKSWASPEASTADWKPFNPLGFFEAAGLAGFDGIVWARRELELASDWAGKEAVLHLGNIDDDDTTFVNGQQIGATEGHALQRTYKIPANLLKAGRNVLAIRILDTGGNGGFGNPASMRLEMPGQQNAIDLSNGWMYRASTPLADLGRVPRRGGNPNVPTVLYNGMIAPLIPYALRGVIWYQGESNNERALQYQALFPLLISDWRTKWGQGDFPFLYVQIAPFKDMRPEIREAQLLTLKTSPDTAMVETTDVGDAGNIHPKRKGPVGGRLALAARALAYGEKVEYSGPLFESMKVEGSRAVISFTHTGSGLLAKDGPLKGFVIAGADLNFVPAHAEIRGAEVVVWSEQVPAPIAVRYGWANAPDVNLFNKEGLPASPFRTDAKIANAGVAK